ncbi:hypothetical protein HPC62_13260 [Thermoleptolyngbya sichuanensis A183]|uniref:Uncharacterized protein n=1 Tax=Thermoleptolyngbya sichuanensis A183 TaxID=2737172 RepID=A0A6M8BIY1_9CYAN|nr:hypothetical protein [Thermoleptolyngbya sichuanensis]QKD83033.1 hypothetical protein HPC62_13260 [Thermoleptolyngbya sichuanensis A183]
MQNESPIILAPLPGLGKSRQSWAKPAEFLARLRAIAAMMEQSVSQLRATLS